MGMSLVSCYSVQQGLESFHVRQDPPTDSFMRKPPAEHIWLEVNQRINYLLIQMEANQIIDMTDATVKFCVSWVTTQVPSRLLLTLFNLGIAIVFLATEHAVKLFEQDGQLTRGSNLELIHCLAMIVCECKVNLQQSQ